MTKRVATLGVRTLVLGLFGPVGTVHARPMHEPQPPVRPECISPLGKLLSVLTSRVWTSKGAPSGRR